MNNPVAIPIPCGDDVATLFVHRRDAVVRHKLRWPGGQVYRDATGNDKHPRVVDALTVTLTLPDGRAFTARACCIPPDVFTYREGLRRALRRLLARPGFPPEMARCVKQTMQLRRFGGRGRRRDRNGAPLRETTTR